MQKIGKRPKREKTSKIFQRGDARRFFFSGVKSDVSCKERNQIMFINNTRTYIGIETGHKRLEEVMVIFLHIYIFLNMISSRKAPAVN